MIANRWSERATDRLVDLCYDAAFDGALWPSVLEQIGDRVGAHPANLTQINFLDGRGSGLAARAPDDIMARYFAEWAQRNPIALAESPAAYADGWAPRITRDSESVDRNRLRRSAFWNEFLAPIGAHHLLIMRLSLRGNDVTTITLGRPNHHGAFDDDEIAALGLLHKHLIRAERIWRSLGTRQIELDQFDMLLTSSPDALFFLDDQLRLVRWTAAAEALLRGGGALRLQGGGLRATQGSADPILQRAFAAALVGDAPAPLSLPGARPGAELAISVARLGERASAGVGGSRCLMVSARPLAALDATGSLKAAYRLTTAEADLAIALAAGDNLRAVAERRSVSINTVRNQLSAVFDKTGCRRQQDLVRLLAQRGN